MADFPNSLWAGNTRGANLSDVETHTVWHDEVAAETIAVQTELGVTPSGSLASVAARLTAIDNNVNLSTSTIWATPINAGITIGNGTVTARHARVGPIVCAYFKFTLGSTSAITGDVSLVLPVNTLVQRLSGSAYFDDATDVRYHGQVEQLASNNIVVLRPSNTTGTIAVTSPLSSTSPFTWTTGDIMVGDFWYFVA